MNSTYANKISRRHLPTTYAKAKVGSFFVLSCSCLVLSHYFITGVDAQACWIFDDSSAIQNMRRLLGKPGAL